ncbi:fungal hydrophobin [Imleria badia]|nr:fungal hydrophobin [Imleria badia]
MFTRVFALFPLALLASASYLEARQAPCKNGRIECCDSLSTIQDAKSVLLEYNLLSAARDLGGLVGQQCSPLTVFGASSNRCTEQVACCKDVQQNGLIALGCSYFKIL